jgi:sugar (pentulose or hexulose) kinase
MSAADPIWVGLDLGTQSARALAVTATGTVAGRGARPLRSHRERDRHEQDPRSWWPAVAGACRDALAGIAPERIAGVATCATSGTVLLIAADGEPLTPALMYDDARVAGFGEAKLRVLLAEPAAREPGASLAHQPDLVTRALAGGPVATDESHALKSGWDAAAGAWARELGDAAAALLPDVVPSGTRLGAVCAAAAEASGLPPGTPVIAGMTDGCAAQLATGALHEGAWTSVLGTTLVLKGVSSRRIGDPGGIVYSHRAPGGGWLPGGASSCGAGVLTERFPGRDLDALGRLARAHEDGAPVAYPLAGRGERFPFHAPEAQGFMLGEPGGEGEHFAALLQGLAYVERLCLDCLSLLGAPVDGELSLTGGATRSRYWCALRADVLGRPVRLPAQAESAFGMAVLAAAATSGRTCAETAAALCRTRAVIEPRRSARFVEPYLRLVGELERRAWLPAPLAAHARERAAAA